MTLSVKANKYLYLLYLEPIQHSQPPEENRAALFLKIFHQIHIFTSPTLYQKNRYFRLYAFCPYLYGKYRSNKDRKPTVGADNGNTCNPGPAETEKPEIKFWRCSHLSLSLQKIGGGSAIFACKLARLRSPFTIFAEVKLIIFPDTTDENHTFFPAGRRPHGRRPASDVRRDRPFRVRLRGQ